MKYTVSVKINKSRDEVIDLFDSIDNMYKWQNGLKSFTILEGEKGMNGLKSKMVYEMNGKDTEMIETVELFDFPNKMIAVYEAKGVWNRCVNSFSDQGQETIWEMETEFKMKGFMKVLEFFGKKMFISQTESDMNRFKTFAETH